MSTRSGMETYNGHVRAPADAIKLFEACRLGLLPRVQRRLSEKERQSIKSGSVFVWDEREAGMRRWTDGKSWSASRVSGSFLTYREMEGKRGGGGFPLPATKRVPGKTPDSGRGSDEDLDMDGDGPDGYRYKPDGLMKQSFSITTSTGQHLHLISYFARPHPNAPELVQPTTDPALRHIVPAKGMYPESTVHDQAPPTVSRTPAQAGYVSTPQQAGPPMNHSRPPYMFPATQGYNWPPSPVSTPPYNYSNGAYAQLPPPPPGGSHNNSPLLYAAHPHQHGHPHPGQHQNQQPSSFDRVPPPLQNSSLPPPPPNNTQQRQHPSQGPPQMHGPPMYAPNPSPRVAQGRLVAEQQAQVQSQAQQAQRLSQQLQAQSPAIDPRIAATAAAAIQQVNGGSPRPHSASGHQPPSTHDLTPTKMQNQGINGASQNIPSISSLVHASDTPNTNDTRSNGSASRQGSSSPKGGSDKQGPRDIPHDKIRFGGGGNEDSRVLGVLDRKFCI